MAVSTDASANRGLQGQITSTVFTVLALIFVILRLVTRVGIVHNGGADDWMIAVSLVSFPFRRCNRDDTVVQSIERGPGRC